MMTTLSFFDFDGLFEPSLRLAAAYPFALSQNVLPLSAGIAYQQLKTGRTYIHNVRS